MTLVLRTERTHGKTRQGMYV